MFISRVLQFWHQCTEKAPTTSWKHQLGLSYFKNFLKQYCINRCLHTVSPPDIWRLVYKIATDVLFQSESSCVKAQSNISVHRWKIEELYSYLGSWEFHNPGFSREAKQNINVAVLLFFVIFVCFGGTIIILEMWNLKFNLAGFEKCLFWRGAD